MNKRCDWCLSSDLMIEYHDKEWGVPLHDDKKLFEYMLLDAFQAGLSWSTIINKRKNFAKAFDGFDVVKISRYRDGKIKKLLNDAGIVRNRLKIHSAVSNAKAFLNIQKEFGSFDKYIWQFVKGKSIVNKYKSLKDIPVSTKESDAMSKDLKAKGFRFAGTTICYAFMQAAGMVNDHITDCYRYKELRKLV